MAKEPLRTLSEILDILRTRGPGALTPAELKFAKSQVKKVAYDRKKGQQLEKGRAKTKAGQDIGPIPEPKDLGRRQAAWDDLLTFCNSYFRQRRFTLPWSPDHLIVIARYQEAITQGGLFALAMPRGSGKTSLAEVSCLWATLTGRHLFVLLLGSSKEAALEMMDSIKEDLMDNDELADDFPEVCFPIRALENRANRCKGQHTQGKATKPQWGPERIVFPTIEGSKASGAIIRVAGITGRIRGAKKDSLRPTLCIPDDPQTDTSAESLSQCAKRARIINGAVLGLAGPGKKITVIMPCTVIRQGDLADTFLDREKSPLWTGQRFKMAYELPKSSLWDTYAVIRADEFRNGGDGSQATAFYAQHRAEMDAGAVVAWPERHEPDELSAVQHVMNLRYKDPWSFAAEYQNEPLTEDLGSGQLEADAIAQRLNGLSRGVVPEGCSHVTAFVDVQQSILYYLVAAWSDDFTGAVVDYGTFPDQGRQYFTVQDAQNTLARAFPGAGLEGQIHQGLAKLAELLLDRGWERADGARLKIERMLVDAGFQTETVNNWTRSTQHAAVVMASHGHAITASSKPFSEYDRTRCDRIGTHWYIPKPVPGKPGRHVTIDVNFWKTFVSARLMQTIGDKGALSLYGKPGQGHRMLADHLTAEYGINTEGRGRKLREWRIRPGYTENHWWDCLVGSAVAANMMGASILGEAAKPSGRKFIDVKAEQAARRREFEARRRY